MTDQIDFDGQTIRVGDTINASVDSPKRTFDIQDGVVEGFRDNPIAGMMILIEGHRSGVPANEDYATVEKVA